MLGDPQSFHYGSPYSVNKSVFTVYLGGDCVQKKTRTAVVHCAPAIDCRMPKHNSDLYLFFFFRRVKGLVGLSLRSLCRKIDGRRRRTTNT